MRPLYKNKENMPEELLKSKAKDKSFLEDMVLMEQEFIENEEKKTVREILVQKQYEFKAKIDLQEFLYFDSKQ